jgi:arabinose-5-phosphate isomerase
MEAGGLGVTLVVSINRRLVGIITDGDIRRMLVKKIDIYSARVDEIMTSDPRSIVPETAVYDALYLMETHQITVLPIVDPKGTLQGIVHLHDILGKGQFRFNSDQP